MQVDNEKLEEKKENFSPITSDDEDIEEGETFLNQKNAATGVTAQKSENPKQVNDQEGKSLQSLLHSDDLGSFEEYINSHFSNLSQEDLLSKLMELDDGSRIKLLQMITQYQRKSDDDEQEVSEEKNLEGQDVIMQNTVIQQPPLQQPQNPIQYSQQYIPAPQQMQMGGMMAPNMGTLYLI